MSDYEYSYRIEFKNGSEWREVNTFKMFAELSHQISSTTQSYQEIRQDPHFMAYVANLLGVLFARQLRVIETKSGPATSLIETNIIHNYDPELDGVEGHKP